MKENIFNYTSVEEIDPVAIYETASATSFAAIRGLFGKEEIGAAYATAARNFDASRDQPSLGESPGAVMENFQKLSIGGASAHWDYRPRFMRVIYNPLWCEDVYGMHGIFRKLTQARNRLQGYPLDYAVDDREDGFWTAARMQHYPRGGGNISRHRDVVISSVTQDAGLKRFYQFVLLLTTRGEHFQEGGAYIEKDGVTHDLEAFLGAGDLLVYNGASMHGVHDIDPGVVPDLSSFSGRLVALASLYRDMSKDDAAYEGYEGTDIDAEEVID